MRSVISKPYFYRAKKLEVEIKILEEKNINITLINMQTCKMDIKENLLHKVLFIRDFSLNEITLLQPS